MIRLGKHVTQSGDQLYDVDIVKVHQAILNPEGEVAALQRRLQAIRAMDPGQYRKMKVSLPYLVCAQFHPKVRRKENFLYAERFLVDIDHLSDFGLEMETLKALFKKDVRVELMFASPSGDGLKLLFRIDQKIKDPNYYVVFYKAFCLHLENLYHLGAALDHKTHDVSRCCFVSFDPEAYYNPESESIPVDSFVSPDNLFEMDFIQKEAVKIERENSALTKVLQQEEKSQPGQDLPDNVLAFIKEKIGQKIKRPMEKEHVQPEELEDVVNQIRVYLTEIGAEIALVKPISYGRQIKITSGKIWAEINVYFGKKGVTLHATIKSGSHKEFGKTVTEFLKASFEEVGF